MPDLTLEEADKCPHCGAILRYPPICCPRMSQEAAIPRIMEQWKKDANEPEDPDFPMWPEGEVE